MGAALATAGLVLIVVGTIALGLWALWRHDRHYPKGVHLEPREKGSIETKTTWLSGGRG